MGGTAGGSATGGGGASSTTAEEADGSVGGDVELVDVGERLVPQEHAKTDRARATTRRAGITPPGYPIFRTNDVTVIFR